MTYIVKEINIFTNRTVGVAEFKTEAEAIEYAQTMNELMKATPLIYKYQN